MDEILNNCIDNLTEDDIMNDYIFEPLDGDETQTIADRFLELLNERNSNI